MTRNGRIYRSGSPDKLTVEQWFRISDLGITSLVDLRNTDEIQDPGTRPDEVSSLSRPLEDQRDHEFMDVWGEQLGSPAYYGEILARWPNLVASAFIAIAEAPTGAVLIHCGAGRDRTGMITAMLLILVGASREQVLNDYESAVREFNQRLLVGDLRAQSRTDTELDAHVAAARDELSAFLDALNVESFLLDAGVSRSQLSDRA